MAPDYIPLYNKKSTHVLGEYTQRTHITSKCTHHGILDENARAFIKTALRFCKNVLIQFSHRIRVPMSAFLWGALWGFPMASILLHCAQMMCPPL